ncbi:MAG: hypothetical protein DRJ43_01885 [Thermoprotei archaeon]|nr:MAG: hypothetical protein DRJ43_01885 [Thermoprotei archaeon]
MEMGVSIQPFERVYRLVIRREAYDYMLREAEREYPIEACGVLAGSIAGGVAVVEEAASMKNLLASNRAFWFDAKEWMRLIMEFESRGLEYIGLYHTHDRPEPLLSLSDRHRMLECPGEVWVVIAYRPHHKPRIAAYRIDDYGSSILRLPVVVEHIHLP